MGYTFRLLQAGGVDAVEIEGQILETAFNRHCAISLAWEQKGPA